ncbi:hypothetical protein [Kordia jejudonensis]|uniref:hypothetical protein n=1 Tax=Kordia jejudonensis TaxID=1348245 RepID=UPI00062939E0|nr:hypothetical protein [Kordia jejudonensis]
MTDKRFEEIIHHYKTDIALNPDTWISHCAAQNSIEEAIFVAATARNHEGKKNPHQYRLKPILLEKFAVHLTDHASDLEQATSFEELLEKVTRYKTSGIGTLALYDTAERIGAYLDIFPNKIYLHAGVKVGAEKILGKLPNRKFIYKEELPEAFQQTDLHCNAIEDILCRYKDRFDDDSESFLPQFFPNAGPRKKHSC